jgi:3-deoxy-7-phosphoheptulonate synthase
LARLTPHNPTFPLALTLLLDLTALGLPAATEVLVPIIVQYIDDLVTWVAIGARTIESQTHREMASGLSVPVGFKNGTDGSLQIAVDAMHSARTPHRFLGIDQEEVCGTQTPSNSWKTRE